VSPGTYSVSLSRLEEGTMVALAGPMAFEVKRLQESSIATAPEKERIAYDEAAQAVMAGMSMQRMQVDKLNKELATLREVAIRSDEPNIAEVMGMLRNLEETLESYSIRVKGEPSKTDIGEKTDPNVYTWLWAAAGGSNSTYGPTAAGKENLALAQAEANALQAMIDGVAVGKEKMEVLMEGWVKPGY
jgi:hypothetical protein